MGIERGMLMRVYVCLFRFCFGAAGRPGIRYIKLKGTQFVIFNRMNISKAII